MRLVATLGLALTIGVLALPRHGTPSERAATRSGPTSLGSGAGAYGQNLRLPPSRSRSLGVSLAADRDPPVETITITLPRSKPKHRHVGASRRTHNARWAYGVASAYSAASTGSTRQGCPGAPPLTDGAASFASLIVPCGAHVEFCARRCIVATRTDSGPYVAGRSFDLNVGTVHALIGSWSPFAWGVRTVRWRRVR